MKNLSHKGIESNDQLPEHFGTNNRLMAEVQKIATQDTAQYFYNQEEQPEWIPADEPETLESLDASKQIAREQAWSRAHVDGYVLEAGVHDGTSFIPMCEHFKTQTVFGFDGFKGLPGGVWPGNMIHKGAFDHGGEAPFKCPDNGTLVVGWFKDTMPNFDYGKAVAKYLHIDCDVYESTVDILSNSVGKIVSGTVITFDDYCNHPNWRQGEWKAWQEFCQANNIKYKYLYVAGMSVSLIVK